jgi:microcystin-dependent protein
MDYYIGEIELFPFGFAPMGWMLCNGTIMQIMQNQALYSLIGNRFGGNGTSTFAIPNLTNDTPALGMNYYICIYGIYPSRQ